MKPAASTTPRDRIAAWLNLQQASRVIENRLEERLRAATGLSWPEFELLWRLQVVAGRPLRMSEIAAQLLASPSGLTRIADRLERDGLIARETPRDNRRVVRVTLTERGREVLAKADRAFAEALRESFSGHLSEEEVDWLRRILRKLLEQNGAWAPDRCEPRFPDPDSP
jgi:DNA-binding MarR family transcriptional regulator